MYFITQPYVLLMYNNALELHADEKIEEAEK